MSREPFENICDSNCSNKSLLNFFYTTQTPAERRSCDLGGNSITSPQKRTRNNSEAAAEASPRKSSRLASAVPVEASPRKSTRVTSTPQKTDPTLSSPRKHTRMTNVDTSEGSPRKSSRLENISQKDASKTESPRKAAKPIISTPTSRPAKCDTPKKTAKDQTTAQQSKQKTAKTENNTPRKTAGVKRKIPQVSQRHEDLLNQKCIDNTHSDLNIHLC